MPIPLSAYSFGQSLKASSMKHAAGVGRRHDQNVTNFVKNVNFLEFGYYIWNPFEKCIQKSPNMPGISSLICERDVKISEI